MKEEGNSKGESLDPLQVIEIARETAHARFVTWCNEGYEALQRIGVETIQDIEKRKEANLAMRRMLALFIDREEYEKCAFLKTTLEANFPGETEPLFDYREI